MQIYRIAKDMKPYKIILITPGGSKVIGKIDAHSEAQAKKFFLANNSSDYRAYLEMGYVIRALLDKEELKRRQNISEYEEKRKEDQIQNAWWNN